MRIKEFSENTWAVIILVLSFIYLFAISLFSKGLYGDADSIVHYQFARYAFKYPFHFVDHWAKPLFTTLSAPFAQLGFQGAMLFNILCGLLTAWLIYRIAVKLNYRYALAVIPFSLFAPIYMTTMFSSLTEILFGLVLVAAIFFFLKQKSILSAVIISFIPFARNEGLIFIFIFLLAFLLKRRFRALPFLLTGFVVFGIAGYFHYKDLFWFFTAMPYNEAGSSTYGSGSFWYYTGRFHELLGWPLTLLAGIGLVWLAVRLFKDNKPSLSDNWLTQYYLVIGSFLAFLLAHSMLWWQGMMAVLASHRFMACIMPLAGFMALAGLNFLFIFTGQRLRVKRLLLILIIVLTLVMPYAMHKIPARLTKSDQVMKESAQALKKMGYRNKKIMYFDPKLAFYLKEDPFESGRIFCYLPDPQKPERDMPDSSFLVWDTHFGELEKMIFLGDLLHNPNFRLIDGFVPDKEFRFFTGLNYMSLIFRKVHPGHPADEWITIDSLDFESSENPVNIPQLTDTVAYTGNKSIRVYANYLYSITAHKKLDEISSHRKVILRGRVKALMTPGADPEKLFLVVEVRHPSDKMHRYIPIPAKYFKPVPGEWFEMTVVTPLELDFPENGLLKLYAWNNGTGEIFVDDLILEYLPVNY